jgi:metal-dependent amidase/aminoacylase/carboxypeptidase family protein
LGLCRAWLYGRKEFSFIARAIEKEGFQVQAGIAGIPTAFVATYGAGKPVIGILGEYDALPGLAQEATPEIKPIPNQKEDMVVGITFLVRRRWRRLLK